MPREPFDVKQLEYLAKVAGHAHEVFARAVEHMNRTGASQELYEPIHRAMGAVGAIGVHLHYLECVTMRPARDAREYPSDTRSLAAAVRVRIVSR